MKGKDFIVHTIPEFLTVINEIKETEEVCWFRGHKDVRYKLAPNLYRESELERTENNPVVCSLNTGKGAKRYKFIKDQASAFETFKKEALAFVSQKPVNDFEWLVLFQHYGGNTQLLDWTTNPLISLYFATSNLKSTPITKAKPADLSPSMSEVIEGLVENGDRINAYDLGAYDYSDYAVIYIINPLGINDTNLMIHEPRVIVDNSPRYHEVLGSCIQLPSPQQYPICVEAPKNDRRTYIQGSVFTLHGLYVDGLDWFTGTMNSIYKIYISNSDGVRIRSELRSIHNINHSFVYQDLANVVKDAITLKAKTKHNK